MITISDVKNILLKEVKANDVLGAIPEIKKDKHKPVTEKNVKERVVVVANASSNDSWQRTYAHVCVYVPDIEIVEQDKTRHTVPNDKRLRELETVCRSMFFRKLVKEFNNETCVIQLENITDEGDPETWSTFLNVRLKVKNTNFKL